eukprot:c25792_g1_i1 orf=400-1740(-)
MCMTLLFRATRGRRRPSSTDTAKKMMIEKLSSSLPHAQKVQEHNYHRLPLHTNPSPNPNPNHHLLPNPRGHCVGNPSHRSLRFYSAHMTARIPPQQPLSCRHLSSLSSSSFHGSRSPLISLLGLTLPEIWRDRKDLQPCQAILGEDLAKVEPMAAIIDGKAIAQKIKEEVAEEVTLLRSKTGKVPGLAVVLVGERKDSETYVRSKKKGCKEVGIESYGENLPENASEEEVLKVVQKFNEDPAVHGILIQLPLPKHLNQERILAAVSVEKDVDGFHPLNIGKLAMQGRTPLFVPCTPRGCIELLVRSNVEMKGKHAVVIGRSNIVGTPAAMLLQRHQATVTVVHSYTPNPAEVTRRADIVIAAVGVAHLVRGDWIKPGAVVIDVGINAIEDPSSKKGYRLVGDVCFKEASMKASAITPVPGGVGPMTIAMLLSNTLDAAKRANGLLD